MKTLYCYRYGILGGVCTQLINSWKHLSSFSQLEAHFLFSQDDGAAEHLRQFGTVHIGLDTSDLYQWVEENQFDVVIIIDSAEYFEVLSRKERSYALIAEVHTSIPRNLLYLNNFALHIDAFMTPSQYMKNMLIKEFHIPASKIQVVFNSLDTELFSANGKQLASSNTSVNHSDLHRPILLWVGKIDDHKNWKDYVKICQKLKMKGLDFSMWIVGGHICLQDTAEKLLDAVDAAELMPIFRWLDCVEQKDMPRVYRKVAASGGCKIITSKCESFGMSLVESLCCLCPTVSTRVGALPEIRESIVNSKYSYEKNLHDDVISYFELGDCEDACEKVEAIITNIPKENVQTSLVVLQERLTQNFSLKNAGEQYLSFLKSAA